MNSRLNPKYYDKMSELLDALIAQRRKEALDYKKYLEQIIALAKKVVNPSSRRGVSRRTRYAWQALAL